MSFRKSWIEKLLLPERAPRRPAEQFFAYRLDGSTVLQEPIRNISSSGAYLETKLKLVPETHISIVMQSDGPFELNPARRVTALARVVRVDSEGAGLAFIPPGDSHARRWTELVEYCAREIKPKEMLAFLQLNAGITFLSRISPKAAEEIDQLVRTKFSNYRIQHAIEIALKAERGLSSEPDGDKLRADPKAVVRIVENGSNAAEDWLQDQWAGLLAASCSIQGQDEVEPAVVETFSRLTPSQVRILTSVCVKSTKVRSEDGKVAARPLTCDLNELMVATGARDVQIDRDIKLLSDVGLLEMSKPSILTTGQIDLTPSAASLLLHASYNGHRGKVEEFYSVAS
jgi:hypothetical protein